MISLNVMEIEKQEQKSFPTILLILQFNFLEIASSTNK